MRLIDGMNVFWTDKHHARIGVDSRIGAALNSFSSQEISLVAQLTRPHTSVEYYEMARKFHIPRSRAQHIAALLDSAGLLTLDPPHIPDCDVYTRWKCKPPEQRASTHIHISRLDWLGVSIALILARSGIGTITSADDGNVTAVDHPALAQTMIGFPRIQALESALQEANPAMSLHPQSPPDAAVLTSSYGNDPHLSRALTSKGIPVLHAWVEEIDIILGPFTLPHSSACGTCVHLHRIDADPDWAVIAPQAFAACPITPHIANSELAAAIAAREVLLYLDGFPSNLHERLCVIPSIPTLPYLLPITPHPLCGCAISDAECEASEREVVREHIVIPPVENDEVDIQIQ